MATLTPRETLDAARLRAVIRQPYLRAALWALVPVEKPGLGTIGVDSRWRMYWCPEQVQKWGVNHVAGILTHEVAHLLRKHHARAERIHAEPGRWNIAGDAEINQSLALEGVALPDGLITPVKIGQPDGLLVEEYYRALEDAAQDDEKSESGDGDDGGGAAKGQGDNDNDGPAQSDCEGPVRPSDAKGGGSGEGVALNTPSPPSPGEGHCGSCAGGPPRDYEDADQDNGGVPEISSAEADTIARRVAIEVKQAAKERGDVPGQWKRWSDEILEPQIPWQSVLQSEVRRAVAFVAGRADYTYKRPSRRRAPGVILPAMHRPVPRVAIIIDTSASMSDRDLGHALGEIKAVLRSVAAQVQIVACDSSVQGIGEVRDVSQVRAILGGGGGTDMRKAFLALEKSRPRPEIIIVMTDCETPWPDAAPRGARVIVTRIGGYDGGTVPPWAREVEIA